MEFSLFKHFQYRAFAAPYKAWTVNSSIHPWTHQNPTKYIHFRHLLSVSRDHSGKQQTPNYTNTCFQTPKRLFEDVWWFMLTGHGVCWCLLMLSFTLLCCLEMWGGCLRSFSKGVWVLFMDVFKVGFLWGCTWVFMPCMVDTANALYLKIFARQNSTCLTLMKHQNTKTSVFQLSKNHCFFCVFWTSGKNTIHSLQWSPCRSANYYKKKQDWCEDTVTFNFLKCVLTSINQ